MRLPRHSSGHLATAGGMALGFALDRLLGDPRRWHPVAGFGRVAGWLEQRTYADDRRAGVAFTGGLVGAVVAVGGLAEWATTDRPVLRTVLTAAATWAVLGGRSLEKEAMVVSARLAEHDVPAARVQIRTLVGRDTARLDADGIARACVESVAENTSDAVVAPLLWGAVAGVPGLLGYRAVNTLDAMVGHRSERYRNFGWAAARLDDLANWVPARIAGALAVGGAPVVSGSRVRSLAIMVRDAHRHPSPNAGVVESAFAGALGVRLGGPNMYAGRTEIRGQLGSGSRPQVTDIARATRLQNVVADHSLALAIGLRVARWRGRRPGATQ